MKIKISANSIALNATDQTQGYIYICPNCKDVTGKMMINRKIDGYKRRKRISPRIVVHTKGSGFIVIAFFQVLSVQIFHKILSGSSG